MKRSPKKWYARAVAALRRRGDVDNPRAVAIALWKRMRPSHRRAALAGECTPISGFDSAAIKAAIKATASKVARAAVNQAKIAVKKHGTLLTLRPLPRVKAAVAKMARKVAAAAARKWKSHNPRKGAGMAKRKSHKRRGRGGRFSGGGGGKVRHVMVVGGGGGGGYKKKRRGRRRYHGLAGLGGSKGDMMAAGTNVAIGIAGAIAGALGMRYVPVADARAKAAIPLLLGLVLSVKMRQPMIRAASGGLAIAGGLALIKALAPNLPVLAGLDAEDELLGGATQEQIADQVAAALEDEGGEDGMEGATEEDEELMGVVQDLSGDGRLGYSPASGGPQTVADLLR